MQKWSKYSIFIQSSKYHFVFNYFDAITCIQDMNCICLTLALAFKALVGI